MSYKDFKPIEWTWNSTCPKCHKPYIYYGDVPEGGWTKGSEPYCTCSEEKDDRFNPVGYGWVCPICKTVNAPWVSQCPGQHFKFVTTNTTGG